MCYDPETPAKPFQADFSNPSFMTLMISDRRRWEYPRWEQFLSRRTATFLRTATNYKFHALVHFAPPDFPKSSEGFPGNWSPAPYKEASRPCPASTSKSRQSTLRGRNTQQSGHATESRMKSHSVFIASQRSLFRLQLPALLAKAALQGLFHSYICTGAPEPSFP